MIYLIKSSFIKHLLCPIICVLISIAGYCFVLNALKVINNFNYQKPFISRSNILSKIDEYSMECKEGYWWSWLVIHHDTFSFVDVRGYNPSSNKNTKVFSVKDKGLNPNYLKTGELDLNSKNLVRNSDTGLVGYYSNIEVLKPFTAIYDTIRSANLDIKEFSFSITKDSEKRLIFVFTAAMTSNSLVTCNKADIVNKLHKLAIYAKTQL